MEKDTHLPIVFSRTLPIS